MNAFNLTELLGLFFSEPSRLTLEKILLLKLKFLINCNYFLGLIIEILCDSQSSSLITAGEGKH